MGNRVVMIKVASGRASLQHPSAAAGAIRGGPGYSVEVSGVPSGVGPATVLRLYEVTADVRPTAERHRIRFDQLNAGRVVR